MIQRMKFVFLVSIFVWSISSVDQTRILYILYDCMRCVYELYAFIAEYMTRLYLNVV